jgi:hypothetical protein
MRQQARIMAQPQGPLPDHDGLVGKDDSPRSDQQHFESAIKLGLATFRRSIPSNLLRQTAPIR